MNGNQNKIFLFIAFILLEIIHLAIKQRVGDNGIHIGT
jgi:hypothetical protein